MDERFFEQLDQLQKGIPELDEPYMKQHPQSSADESAYGGHGIGQYGQPDEEPGGELFRLDAFDQELLGKPDYDSRHGQAALGRARLSLAPDRSSRETHSQPETFYVHPQASQLPNLARVRHIPGPPGLSSSSPQRPSSPTWNASQRPPRAINGDSRSQVPNRRRKAQALDRSHLDDQAQTSMQQRDPPAGYATVRQSNDRLPVVQGINLVSARELPDRFRSIFSFPLFNAVQSKCFQVVYKTNDNLVVSAPTGSGKTAVLELAICRLINGFMSGSFKIVYQAPTKSLCSERQRDWQAKFGPLDLHCAELTGDTDNAQLRNVQHASIIVTTPEKWDSVTRKWKDHQKLMQMVKLFLIDEVHILKEDRGATLEAVVSRMKSVGSDVRFIALSATVPNSQDIAIWLGKNPLNEHIPAPRERFGEEFRPVRLQKHVCGYNGNSNDFAFERLLNSKLVDVIAKWSHRKSLMVFCFTRKSCVETAKLLANWWNSHGPRDRYWSGPRNRINVGEKDLKGELIVDYPKTGERLTLVETTIAGVAFHHAGLKAEDRFAVEKGYLEGDVNVICCTSTLAVGVNLPCHMVIIKNTVTYHGSGGCKEYSDLEIMQMLGRAGRPQFDDSAVAVIMTRLPRVPLYEKMIFGSEVLESCLHLNLIDHLNAEIGLGTVTNVSSAKKWLQGTFLYVRLKDNPDHYKIAEDASGRTLDERLEDICRRGITKLEENDLVEGEATLRSTEFGDAMTRYYIRFDTMKLFLALPPKAKISEILSAIAQASEFQDVRFRLGEKPVYRELNKNSSIKFPIPVTLNSSPHKVSLIIQSVLGAIELPAEDEKHRIEYNTCKATIFHHLNRLIRCIIDCQLYLDDSVSVRNALMLARSFGAQAWDDSPLHLKQLDGVGIVSVRKMVAANIRSIEEVETTEPHRLEVACSRNPPYGTLLQARAAEFPRLRISMKTIGEPAIKKGECVTVRVKADIGFINENAPEFFQRKMIYVCLLVDTSDGRKAYFARVSAKKLNRGQEIPFSVDLTSPTQMIRGFVMCDEIAGTQRTVSLKPEVPGFMFPTPKAVEKSNKQQEPTSKVPRTSKTRATAVTQIRANEVDEFGDASLGDDELEAAAEIGGFASIDDFDDEGNQTSQPKSKNRPSASQRDQPSAKWEPQQLANGKWACKHPCREKATCKHLCCKEGLDKKPKPPKVKEQKTNEATAGPKQTQLDLSKTKKTAATSGSAQPPPASTVPTQTTLDFTETHGLNRLHNSVKSSMPNVALLKDWPRTQTPFNAQRHMGHFEAVRHPGDESGSSDYGLDALETDNLPPASAMAATQSESRTIPPLDVGDSNQTNEEMLDSFGDEYLAEMPDEIIEQSPVGRFSGADTYGATQIDKSESHEKSSLKFAAFLPPPAGSRGGIFITGESSSDPQTATKKASKRPALSDEQENLSKLFPPVKKHKPDSAQLHNGQDVNLLAETAYPTPVIDLDDSPAAPPAESVTAMSTREWFEKEFGTELFNYVD